MQTVSRLIEQFIPTHYNLSVTLDREARSFDGTVTIEGTSVSGTIVLHAKDLTISTVHVDGKAATTAQGDNDEVTITQPDLAAGKHIVTLGFSGTITDPMHGLYPCYFEHDGTKKELLATQFESHHAREVFPCVDEPEAKATFDVTLTTEKNIVVLGNMPILSQKEENDRLVTTFATTPKMSSYLLAWVVGDLHKKTTTTKNDVEVNVWATPAQSPEGLDFALDTAVKTIEFFEDYFDTPYPLPKSDHVALPDFSSGAMENWGLITYREVALLADPKTTSISSKRYVATVVAHELAHQWFGNLVTMKWWNDLWLNESFANMMEYFVIDKLYPEWDIWLEYIMSWELMALRRDAIEGVQAVQVDVNHPDEISSLFDGAIVYAKGGRLLRMLQQYVGDEAFRAGLKSYFETYAYRNTEGNDLWDKLSEASGKDIASFMNTWISQSGYPVVHVTPTGLTQEQFFVGPHQPSTKLWPIPLGAESTEDVPALLETAELKLPIAADERFNVGDTAHFITHYQPEHLAALIEKVRSGKLRPIDRLQLLNEQIMLARAGIITSAELIPLLDAYANETDENVWSVIALTIGELKKFVEGDESSERQLRNLAGKIASAQYARLGWDVIPGESEMDTMLRGTILGLMAYSEDAGVINTAKERLAASSDFETLDPDLRSLIFSIAVRHADDQTIVTRLLDEYRSTQSAELQGDICAGLTSTRDSASIDTLLAHMTDTKFIRIQDTSRWFVYLIRGRESRAAAWQWVRDNWGWIEATFGGDKSYDDFPRYAATGLTTREQLAEYKDFFGPKKDIPALTRVIELGTTEIEARVDLIEKDGPAVRKALSNL